MKVKVKGEIIENDDSAQIPTVILTDLEEQRYELLCEIIEELYDEERDMIGSPAVLEGYVRYESETGSWKLRCTDSFEINSKD
ncbi:MAG: hypothetical protein KGY66_00545 [Candidatus Thermoplasmatota archaeon]|nr:hypothetical protein [Candidatus Thermoplasmatota archaeon]MBS3789392.1 hypothetical protein [Candidatus Thermoplasmatota archaeon]